MNTGDVADPAPARAQGSSLGRTAFFVAKLALAAGLLIWLERRGSLQFSTLRVLIADPLLLIANLTAWLVCSVILSTYRWRLLLRTASVDLPLGRATALQTMALFLNLVIPGNVGGDVVKALWVSREYRAPSRAPFLLLAVIERLLGLLGLVFMATTVAIIRWPSLSKNEGMRPLLFALMVLAAGGVIGSALLIAFLRHYGDRAETIVAKVPGVGSVLVRIVSATRLVLAKPRTLIAALLVSMTMHGIAMAYFTLVTRAVSLVHVDYGSVATVFPIGLLTTVLPVSPGGIGVGHVAFDRLYTLIGLSGGATVFNIFLIGQLVPCIAGAVPYLFMKQRESLPKA